MWKIGPECAAQQAKKVSPSTMNCGERNTCESGGVPVSTAVVSLGVAPADGSATPFPASPAPRRTSNAAGSKSTQAPMPMISIAVRQS
jgi:hypothetical protein